MTTHRTLKPLPSVQARIDADRAERDATYREQLGIEPDAPLPATCGGEQWHGARGKKPYFNGDGENR